MNGFLGAVGTEMCALVRKLTINIHDDVHSQSHQILEIADTGILISSSELIRQNPDSYNSLIVDGNIFISDAAGQNQTDDVLQAIESYGLNEIRDVDGFFSLVYFDQRNQSLSLLRDQWGAHAIYYIADKRGIAFSTSILNLVPLIEGTIFANIDAAGRFLITGNSAPEGETFFQDIQQVPSRSLLTIKTELPPSFEVEEFHTPIYLVEKHREISYQDAVDQTRALLQESIAHCLAGASAPGFTLSGGLDSSSLAIIASGQRSDMPISTYSYVTNARKSIDEERYMDIVNTTTSSNSNKLRMNAKEYFEELPIATKQFGLPVAGASHLAQYLLYRLAAQNNVDVMINGVEADSAFSGHHYFIVDRFQELIDRREWMNALKLVLGISQLRDKSTYKIVILEATRRLPKFLSKPVQSVVLRNNESKWLGFEYSDSKIAEMRRSSSPGGEHRLHEHLRLQLSSDRLLRYAELSGTAFSIYSRTPFLFRRMNEFIFSLPSEYLISQNGETKQLLRSVAEGIVPEEILNRRDKIGFEAPTKDWFLEELDRVREYLNLAVELGIIAPDHGLVDGSIPRPNTLSRVISYTEWAKSFNVHIKS